jgi:SAM-dependent methyltransferase
MPSEEYCGRVSAGGSGAPQGVVAAHLERYRFASAYCAGACVVVDVACGSGYGSRVLRDAGPHRAYGVDVDAAAVQGARDKYGTKVLSFVTADAARLPLADDSVDVLVSFETIEHVDPPWRCVAEARRVLKKGGLYLVSTPNGELPGAYLHGRPRNPFHKQELREHEFTGVLTLGFSEVELFGQHFVPVSALGRLVRRAALREILGTAGDHVARGLSALRTRLPLLWRAHGADPTIRRYEARLELPATLIGVCRK